MSARRSEDASASETDRPKTIASLKRQVIELLATQRELEQRCEELTRAVETRDLIGQAKGIVMSTTGCTPETAFNILVLQSQHENRKLVEIAADIQRGAIRR